MISALEACERSSLKISPDSLKQLEEIEEGMLKQLNSSDPDNVMKTYYFYETDLLRTEVRVLLKKLGYKIVGESGYDHKYRYRIDWRDMAVAIQSEHMRGNRI